MVVVMSVLVASGACVTGDAPSRPAAAPPVVYAAVGASETAGVGADDPKTQAWPTVFFNTAVAGRPAKSTYTNVGISGAKVSTALERELAGVLAVKPTLVTVWLNVNDLIARVPAATYESQLRQLVHGLRQGGRARVLVANTPPVEAFPSARAFAFVLNPLVDAYNEAIARVCRDEGAEVVDLHAAGAAAVKAGRIDSLLAADKFHPSTAGHAAVAAQFAAVYQHQPPR
jgi:lysophospholipase L1-like esterase